MTSVATHRHHHHHSQEHHQQHCFGSAMPWHSPKNKDVTVTTCTNNELREPVEEDADADDNNERPKSNKFRGLRRRSARRTDCAPSVPCLATEAVPQPQYKQEDASSPLIHVEEPKPLLELEQDEHQVNKKKRRVQFATCSNDNNDVCKTVFEYESHKHYAIDPATLWWTPAEFQDIAARNTELYLYHRHNPESSCVQQQLLHLWEQCYKPQSASAGVGAGVGRRHSIATRNAIANTNATSDRPILMSRHRNSMLQLRSAVPNLDVSGLYRAMQQQQQQQQQPMDADTTTTAATTAATTTTTTRGLEGGMIPDVLRKRRAAMEGVLNAQTNLAQTHPTMRARILSKTATYLSRSSVCFAKAMADLDAHEVLLDTSLSTMTAGTNDDDNDGDDLDLLGGSFDFARTSIADGNHQHFAEQ